MDEVRVEAMAQRDAGNRGTVLGALLNDLDFEGIGVGRRCGRMKYPLKRLERVPT